MPEDQQSNWISLTLLWVACIFLAFIVGIFFSINSIFPTDVIRQGLSEMTQALDQSSSDSRHYLHPLRYPVSGVTIFNKEKAEPGVTIVTSYWRSAEKSFTGIRLIDMNGELLNEWEVHPEKVWPQSPHKDYAGDASIDLENYVHGTWLLEGGDIVFNIEYLGMVRMDSCGNIVWKLPLRTHHSVFRNEDGNFWVSGLHWQEVALEQYPHLRPPYVNESLVLVSPEGKVLRELFVLDALYQSDHIGLLAVGRTKYDVTHMNDVEELSSALADDFPMFEQGDLLVSLRNLNLIMVVDGKTEQIKWFFTHPLLRQHDPDFIAGGLISVYDNRDEYTENANVLGGSRILNIDPQTNEFVKVYPTSSDQPFYSQAGGKHQYLNNGNLLLTEPTAGRIIEVTPDGETVWSWQAEPWGALVPEVLEGTRYPVTMTTSCPQS
ncbi:MAG: hypothetical protein GY727_12555 [Gammaproteobacteria bacterium]|nr:hypothetical protein [Gammaproteobacteria bacterium]MCP4930103.1 hypothetical protein [Gammaproteobacteria bacterium]